MLREGQRSATTSVQLETFSENLEKCCFKNDKKVWLLGSKIKRNGEWLKTFAQYSIIYSSELYRWAKLILKTFSWIAKQHIFTDIPVSLNAASFPSRFVIDACKPLRFHLKIQHLWKGESILFQPCHHILAHTVKTEKRSKASILSAETHMQPSNNTNQIWYVLAF